MGSAKSSNRLLKDYELLEYSKISTFTHDEIDHLYRYYVHFSASRNDDGVIDYYEFCQAMGLPDNLVTKRIFQIFDANDDNVINFREFLTGLAYFLYETTEQQILLSFRLFDIEGKGYCTKEDLKSVVLCYLSTMHGLLMVSGKNDEDRSTMLEAIAGKMADETFASVGTSEPGKITYMEYRRLYFRDNIANKWLSMDMEKVRQGVMVLSRRVPKNVSRTAKGPSGFCF